MSQSLQEMIAQREALDAAIKAQQEAARADAITAARKFCEEHGLTAADVWPTASKPTASRPQRGVVPIKYRDDKGNTWSGRGVKPRWLTNALANEGVTLEQFRVTSAQ